MTEPIEGQEKNEDETKLSDAQQKLFNKRIGEARVKAREIAKAEFEAAQKQATEDTERDRMAAEKEWQKLADMHSARVVELEPFEVEAMAYRALVTDLLKDRIKELGDAAKVAVKALPESMSDLEKLNWLNKSQALFATEGTSRVGTPTSKQKKLQKKKGVADRRRVHL